MKIFHTVIPNLAISLNLVMMILIYLDMRNPMMAFIDGTPFYAVAIASCIVSLASAVTLYGAYRKKQKEKHIQENNLD